MHTRALGSQTSPLRPAIGPRLGGEAHLFWAPREGRAGEERGKLEKRALKESVYCGAKYTRNSPTLRGSPLFNFAEAEIAEPSNGIISIGPVRPEGGREG